jgi:predicted cupin superfamily sugar epimerase
MSLSAEYWIRTLHLQPHPEGGFFAETWRSHLRIPRTSLPEIFTGDRSMGTAIYYLLTPGSFSHLHRLRTDEIWHHYDGGVLQISVLQQDGSMKQYMLGKAAGATPQLVIPAGVWFGAKPLFPGEYVLAGCTMAPGFDFDDFEMGSRDMLLREYPDHAAVILDLTK